MVAKCVDANELMSRLIFISVTTAMYIRRDIRCVSIYLINDKCKNSMDFLPETIVFL